MLMGTKEAAPVGPSEGSRGGMGSSGFWSSGMVGL
jgi:hypothetical protein